MLFYQSILHYACLSGNLILVEYLLSLKELNINNLEDIFSFLYVINEIQFYIILFSL